MIGWMGAQRDPRQAQMHEYIGQPFDLPWVGFRVNGWWKANLIVVTHQMPDPQPKGCVRAKICSGMPKTYLSREFGVAFLRSARGKRLQSQGK